MRTMIMIAIAATFCAIATPRGAQAQTWSPWCAVYWSDFGEHRSCGYASFEQCRSNASSGLGEVCMQNYDPGPANTARAEVKRPRKR